MTCRYCGKVARTIIQIPTASLNPDSTLTGEPYKVVLEKVFVCRDHWDLLTARMNALTAIVDKIQRSTPETCKHCVS